MTIHDGFLEFFLSIFQLVCVSAWIHEFLFLQFVMIRFIRYSIRRSRYLKFDFSKVGASCNWLLIAPEICPLVSEHFSPPGHSSIFQTHWALLLPNTHTRTSCQECPMFSKEIREQCWEPKNCVLLLLDGSVQSCWNVSTSRVFWCQIFEIETKFKIH